MKLNAFVVLCATSLLLSACSPFSGNNGNSTPATPEPAYLGAQKVSYGVSPFQVQATGKFKYRPTILGGGTTGLYPPTGSTIKPIPYAEYQVYNSSGTLVQAGETNSTGVALFDMPSTAGTYTLKVLSRAFNANLKISVLIDKYANQPYAISKSFTVTSGDIAAGTPKMIGDVVAEADEALSSAIEGGAFNIYSDILAANDYIRATTSQPAWVAEKVTVYWKAGFNPYTYFSSSAPSLSFYVPGTSKLYILGGKNGNVRTADTDHFDDSVILHEYGHFLEDIYGHSDSPGGSHNGDFVVDPRLAWSEGFANYFQSAVLTNNAAVSTDNSGRARYYLDTFGYKNTTGDSSGGLAISVDLNTTAVGARDAPSANEGEFREMSVARTLFKATRSPASTVGGASGGGNVSFAKIWQTFSDSSSGLRNANVYPTPSMGLFLELLTVNIGGASSNLTEILTNENQRSDTVEYADKVSWGNVACTRSMTGAAESYLDSTPRSNQVKSNDFYLFYFTGAAGDASINLSYTPTNASNATTIAMNLDLIVYKASYVYFEDYDWYSGESNEYVVKQSRRETLYETRCSNDSGKICEPVSLSGQPAGWYMINVKASAWYKNGSGNYQLRLPNQVDGTVPYNLINTAGNKFLCP